MTRKKSKPQRPRREKRPDQASEVNFSPGLRNKVLAAVMLLALVTRLYYLFLTVDQPVWWDEANYLVKAKAFALGTPETGYDPGRPILFSILMAPFFSLHLGEFGIRIALFAISLLGIFETYRVGSRLVDPWVGVIAAALFSCNYMNLFYGNRIMCEIPYVTAAMLALDLFLSQRRWMVLASGPLFAVVVMLRYPAFIVPVCLLLVVLLTERGSALRKKDYWICLGLAALAAAPDLLIRGRGTISAQSNMLAPRTFPERLSALGETIRVFYELFDPVSKLGLLAGLLLAGWYLATWKARDHSLRNSHLLLLALLCGPVLLQGIWITHLEDRYLYIAICPAFLLMGSVAWHFVRFCPGGFQVIGSGVAFLVVLCACALSLQFANTQVVGKLTSYKELKTVGEWLKQQQDDSSVLLTQSVAQLTYYSERPARPLPDEQEEFLRVMGIGEARFAVLSGFETQPEWVGRLDIPSSGLEMVKAEPVGQPVVQVLKKK